MRWIVGSSLKFRFLVVALAAALMAFGTQQLRDMPVDAFPEFAPPRVEIQTICLGLSAAEVEQLVSIPLEQSLNGVEGLDVIRSKSVPQLSSIELLFKDDTDVLHARQLVQERVEAVTPSLPTWAAPPFMMPPTSTTSRVMKIGVSSKTVGVVPLSTIAYWKIRARLLRVPGVANVAIWGEHLEQLHVQVDPARMRERHVGLEQVMESTSDALDAGLLRFSDGAVIGTGGFIDTPNQRLTLQHVLPIVRPTDLATIPIASRGQRTVRLGDVAQVVTGTQPLAGDAVINDGPGLLLVVEKFPWGNTLDVTHGVETAIDELQPGLPGIQIDTHIFRASNFIETAIDNLARALLIGALLVVLVLGAFLFDWRAALISVVAIPLSLVAAGLVLYWRGTTVNVMVLAGLVIALGVVVDDAIIGVQNILRRLRENHQKGSPRSTAEITLEASLEVRGPIVYATLIILIAMAPIFFLQGLTGAFFRPLVLAYVLAVLVSLLVALTVTPALSLILLSRTSLERRTSPLERWLGRGYRAVLSPVLTRPRWAYLAAALTVVAGIAVVPFLGESLIPTFKERDFLGHWITKPGSSLPEETRVVARASHELRTIPGVNHFGSHIGQAFLADEVAGVNFGENWIAVDPNADYDATLASIEDVVDGYPGMFHDVQTYLNERIDEVLAGASEPIVIRVFGRDLDVLHRKADEIRDAVAAIDGVTDASVEFQEGVSHVEVEVDLAKAQRYGVKPGDVRRATATMIESEEVGDIFRGGRAYDVHVWSTPATRSSLTSLRELPLDTPDGGHVLLGDVAHLRVTPTPNVVHHEGTSRSIDIVAGVEDRDLGSVAGSVERRLQSIGFPQEYHAELLGEFAERQAAQKRLLLFGIAAAIGILLLLQVSLRSWRMAILSFLTLPMALVGGALAAWLSGGVLSLGSLVGFYTVFGIAARNGILMINHFQHLEEHEGETFGRTLVLRGAQERLSPILMTTLATGLALVPLVLAGNVPGHEIEHPLAIVVVGGLVTSTLLNLFVVPPLYLRFGKRRAA
ncbi:MAG TPA: efflux RND transporter permease subunit [Gaiellaceae bacterium]|nr:efflux RND transporter permease subunit [Gaiellaceae bacterium]